MGDVLDSVLFIGVNHEQSLQCLDQNQHGKDFIPAHWMALENMTESINFGILTVFLKVLVFPAHKNLPHGHSQHTNVIQLYIFVILNNTFSNQSSEADFFHLLEQHFFTM